MSKSVSFHPADPQNYVNGMPLAMFAELRRQRPLAWHEDPDTKVGYWAVTRREDLDFIGRSPDLFSSYARSALYHEQPEAELGMLRTLMLNMDPPDHVKYRSVVRNAFTPRAVANYETRLREVSREIIDRIATKGHCEFVTEVAAELPLIAICELVGIPIEDRRDFFDWTNTMIGMDDPEMAASQDAVMLAHMNVYTYGLRLAEEHRTKPNPNTIIGTLLDGLVEGEHLTDDEFCGFFLLLVVAGNETTRTMTSHGMRLLIEHPDQYRKLRDNPALIPGAVEEMLRFNSPVIQFRRTATQDVEINGTLIKQGDKVVLFFPSASHDERVFPQPEKFDIERDSRDNIRGEHRAFGHGEHFCLGSHLARLELRLIFGEIVKQIHNPRFDGDIKYLRSNFINGIKEMPIRFDL